MPWWKPRNDSWLVRPMSSALPSTSPWRRVVLSLLGLGLLALAVHTLFGEHGYVSLLRQQGEIERMEKEIQRLEEENRRLAEEIQVLKSDPEAVERVAREQLKMARPGEKVIILPTEPEQEEASPPPAKTKP